jgi:hypothetical protein
MRGESDSEAERGGAEVEGQRGSHDGLGMSGVGWMRADLA